MGYVDDYLGGYENLEMFGGDWEAAYYSQIPDDDDVDLFDFVPPPRTNTRPRKAPISRNNNKQTTSATGSAPAPPSQQNIDQTSAGAPTNAPAAAPAAPRKLSEAAVATFAEKLRLKEQLKKDHKQMMDELCAGKYRHRQFQYHDREGWHLTIELLHLGTKIVWQSFYGTGRTLAEAKAEAAVGVKAALGAA